MKIRDAIFWIRHGHGTSEFKTAYTELEKDWACKKKKYESKMRREGLMRPHYIQES